MSSTFNNFLIFFKFSLTLSLMTCNIFPSPALYPSHKGIKTARFLHFVTFIPVKETWLHPVSSYYNIYNFISIFRSDTPEQMLQHSLHLPRQSQSGEAVSYEYLLLQKFPAHLSHHLLPQQYNHLYQFVIIS